MKIKFYSKYSVEPISHKLIKLCHLLNKQSQTKSSLYEYQDHYVIQVREAVQVLEDGNVIFTKLSSLRSSTECTMFPQYLIQ